MEPHAFSSPASHNLTSRRGTCSCVWKAMEKTRYRASSAAKHNTHPMPREVVAGILSGPSISTLSGAACSSSCAAATPWTSLSVSTSSGIEPLRLASASVDEEAAFWSSCEDVGVGAVRPFETGPFNPLGSGSCCLLLCDPNPNSWRKMPKTESTPQAEPRLGFASTLKMASSPSSS